MNKRVVGRKGKPYELHFADGVTCRYRRYHASYDEAKAEVMRVVILIKRRNPAGPGVISTIAYQD
jgi:hypothetical protein